jgi:hypothetical protein
MLSLSSAKADFRVLKLLFFRPRAVLFFDHGDAVLARSVTHPPRLSSNQGQLKFSTYPTRQIDASALHLFSSTRLAKVLAEPLPDILFLLFNVYMVTPSFGPRLHHTRPRVLSCGLFSFHSTKSLIYSLRQSGFHVDLLDEPG